MSCLERSDEKRTLRSPTMVVEVLWKLGNDRRPRPRSKWPLLNITFVDSSLHFSPSLTSIAEEKPTGIPVTDACERPRNFATKVEEGRGYLGPFQRYGPIWTSAG